MKISSVTRPNMLFSLVFVFVLTLAMLGFSKGFVKADHIEGSYTGSVFGSNNMISDKRGDDTATSKGLFNPTVIVKVSENEILTYFWKSGTKVKLTIDDPANGNGVDYSETLPVIGGSNLTKDLLFKLKDFKLEPGQLVTLTDGVNADTVLINPVYITSLNNPKPNTIYGIAPPGTMIQAELKAGISIVTFQARSGSDGTWLISTDPYYSSINDEGKLTICVWDADKDAVYYTRPYKTPQIEANLSVNSIEGWDWLYGTEVNVTIDDPANGAGNDFSDTTSMGGNSFYPHFVMKLGSFKLAAGQTITITGGSVSKSHVVRNLAITGVDIDKDSISGTSDSINEIKIWIVDGNGRIYQRTDSLKKGVWISDFAHAGDQPWEVGTFDIKEATQLFLKQEDEDGDATLITQIAANNLPPIAMAGADVVAGKGASVTFDGSHSIDPEGKPLTYDWDLDNDGEFDDASGINAVKIFTDNGIFQISLRVTDDGNHTANDSLTVTISNDAPILSDIVMPVSPQKVKNNLLFSAAYTDPGKNDTITAVWDWDDGTSDAGVIVENDITGNHNYNTPGLYQVKLTLTDEDGESVQKSTDVIIVFAPNAASVFGSGWINLQGGSTMTNLGGTGKLTFDFNASYRRASSVMPSGKTNITIKGKSFKFVSTSYSWMIVKGQTAFLEGSGTVNGKGDYGLLVSIQNEPWYISNSDMLRFKIWNKATKEVILDTQPSEADSAPAKTLVKGSIFIINQ